MKRLVNVNDITHEAWLMYRKRGITGTDAGAITGLNPYESAMDVYENKISENIEIIDNEAMRQGRDLEEYVAKRFMEETGLKVRKANYIFYNEKHPFMLADFDRLICGQNAGLECKTVSPYSADRWKDGKIPTHYQLQVQHYLAVSGYDSWYIAALIFGKGFIIHKIDRDEELISNLTAIEERFWNENVLKKVMPNPDGSEAYSKFLSEKYAFSDNSKRIQLFGVESSLKRRSEIEQLQEKLETEKNEIDQEIKLKMGDAAYAETDGYRISWVTSESARVDTKKLKSEAPDVYEKYLKKTSSRRFLIKVA